MMIRLVLSVFIIFIVCVTGFLSLSRPDTLPLSQRKDSATLRVCEANIYYNNTSPEALSSQLLQTESDIYVLIEWQGDNLDLGLFERKGYRAVVNKPKKGVHGISVLARNELSAQGVVIESPVPGPCRIPFATAKFEFNSKSLSLLGIHAPPPLSGCEDTTDPTIRAISDWVDDGRLSQTVGVALSDQPVIVAGDFNAFSFNKEIQEITASGFTDSYLARRSRYGPTWAPFVWLPSFIRIDYIFVPREFDVVDSYTVSLPGSDHRAVVSDIRVEH